MKNVLQKWVPALLLMTLLAGSACAESRIGTVDLRKVFDYYWKKRQAEAALKERQADMEKEDRNMIEDYKKAKEEYQDLVKSASDPVVSAEEREKRKTAAEERFRRVKELEDSIAQYERTARTTITEQSNRMRANILDAIKTVVSAKAKAGNFGMVIDTAAETVNNTPFVLFTNNENDITDLVIKELNATAPTELPKTDEKAAAPGEKNGKK